MWNLCIEVDKNPFFQARTEVEEILSVEDTGQFLQEYGRVEQQLNNVYNTCELFTTSIEMKLEDGKGKRNY